MWNSSLDSLCCSRPECLNSFPNLKVAVTHLHSWHTKLINDTNLPLLKQGREAMLEFWFSRSFTSSMVCNQKGAATNSSPDRINGNLFCFFSFEPRAFYFKICMEAVPSYYFKEVLDTENRYYFFWYISSIQPFPLYFLNMHNALNWFAFVYSELLLTQEMP